MVTITEWIGELAQGIINSSEKKEKLQQIITVLSNIPEDYYHDGSCGCTHSELKVKVFIEEDKEIELAGEGHRSSNYAYSTTEEWIFGDDELKHLKDYPVFVQLAYLYRKYQKRMKIKAYYKNYDRWTGQHYSSDEEFEIEFEFPNRGIK